ncbi:MAG: PEP-CTERM sorting domain-containing protein [Planctomycetota bacterium]|nr:MAG: PEP-CTERM sorting domain-containing protein [Planctomycetota bacterium]
MRYVTARLTQVFFAGAMLAMASISQVRADLVAGWDFQTTTNGGTATAASPNTPKQYTANFGSGGLFLDGQNGSSDWFVPATGSTNTELNAFSGTAINAGTGFSTTTGGAAALALINQTANSKSAVFRFSMAGFQELVVSYASQRTNSGFTSQAWSYSTDGVNWTDHQTVSNLPLAFATQTLGAITGLDGATDAYLRLTLAGASSATGNNRIDNIQFNATAVPEPTSMLLAGSVALGGVFLRLRRKR